MREADLSLSSVTVSKAMGDYIDPAMSKIAVGYLADAWLRSNRPPMNMPALNERTPKFRGI